MTILTASPDRRRAIPSSVSSSPIVAVIILVVAIGLEGYSFRTAIKESNSLRAGASWWMRRSESRQAAGSAACPGGSSSSAGAGYWRAV